MSTVQSPDLPVCHPPCQRGLSDVAQGPVRGGHPGIYESAQSNHQHPSKRQRWRHSAPGRVMCCETHCAAIAGPEDGGRDPARNAGGDAEPPNSDQPARPWSGPGSPQKCKRVSLCCLRPLFAGSVSAAAGHEVTGSPARSLCGPRRHCVPSSQQHSSRRNRLLPSLTPSGGPGSTGGRPSLPGLLSLGNPARKTEIASSLRR